MKPLDNMKPLENPLDNEDKKSTGSDELGSEDRGWENDQGETTGEDYATRQGKTIEDGGPGGSSNDEEK